MNSFSRRSFLTFLLIASFGILVSDAIGTHSEFFFDLRPGQKQCFTDDIAKGTLFSLIVSNNNATMTGLSLEMTGPDQQLIKKEGGKPTLKIIHTTKDSGMHQFCIKNSNFTMVKVYFHLLQDSGMALFEGILTEQSGIPLLADIISINMKVDHIKQMTEVLSKLEDQNFAKKDAVFQLLPTFAIIFIIIIGIVVFFQVKYLRRFFMEKKYI